MMEAEGEKQSQIEFHEPKSGTEKKFDQKTVSATDLEKAFNLVRIHLEGTDNSAHFPNKKTGLFPKLDPRYKYAVYGHPYNADEVWKPRVDTKSTEMFYIEDLEKPVLAGKLKVLVPAKIPLLQSDKWDEMPVTLKFQEILVFPAAGGDKPKTKVDLKDGQSSIHPSVDNAFVVYNATESVTLQAANRAQREEWLFTIQKVIDYNPDAAKKRKEAKEKKEAGADATKA